VAKAIKAGTDIISGSSNPQPIIDAVNSGLLSEAEVDESVALLLTEMINLGLFEDPYVDPQNALDVVANQEAQQFADNAHLWILLRKPHMHLSG
jgi:beta-glucosidase